MKMFFSEEIVSHSYGKTRNILVFLVTSQGRIVSFEPTNEIDDGDVPYVLVILVALCVCRSIHWSNLLE